MFDVAAAALLLNKEVAAAVIGGGAGEAAANADQVCGGRRYILMEEDTSPRLFWALTFYLSGFSPSLISISMARRGTKKLSRLFS